ncbi:MAG: helix-turn-helix domain-containing protein [Oscillospiraceae bacterium]|nr:helix-turn-helix domain-containing protein [Oscillospiraceae bacterium]
MEQIDPVLEYTLNLGNESLRFSIDENPHKIAQVWLSKMHNHSGFEVHILLGGSCKLDMEGSSLLEAGQIIIIPPGQYHRLMAVTPNQEKLTISVSISEGSLYKAVLAAVTKQGIYTLSDELKTLAEKILSESRQDRNFHQELIKIRMAELVILLLRQLDLREKPKQHPEGKVRSVGVIDLYFEANLCKNPKADELAAQLYISRRQLHRLLMKTYGMGFREKLLSTRMNQAKWLLRHTDKTVSAIVSEVGYAHDSAFLQAFRRQFGMTPMEYRLKHRKNQEELEEKP